MLQSLLIIIKSMNYLPANQVMEVNDLKKTYLFLEKNKFSIAAGGQI